MRVRSKNRDREWGYVTVRSKNRNRVWGYVRVSTFVRLDQEPKVLMA